MLITDVLETPRYRQIFDLAVDGHIRNLPPSVADVTRKLGRTASSIHDQAKRLQSEGYIELVGEAKRTRRVVLTEKGLEAADLKPRAPQSAPAFEPSSGFEFNADATTARCGPATFAGSNVQKLGIGHLFKNYRDGDKIIIADDFSMVNPRDEKGSIYPGDICHGRTLSPFEGQNVYVEYGVGSEEAECSIKQYFYDVQTEMVTLHSLNPDYADIVRPLEAIEVVAVILAKRRMVEQ